MQVELTDKLKIAVSIYLNLVKRPFIKDINSVTYYHKADYCAKAGKNSEAEKPLFTYE